MNYLLPLSLGVKVYTLKSEQGDTGDCEKTHKKRGYQTNGLEVGIWTQNVPFSSIFLQPTLVLLPSATTPNVFDTICATVYGWFWWFSGCVL